MWLLRRVKTKRLIQSAGPVRLLKFCSLTIFLLASLLTGRRPQCSDGAIQQGMYSTPCNLIPAVFQSIYNTLKILIKLPKMTT
jgi:hypothetical protein